MLESENEQAVKALIDGGKCVWVFQPYEGGNSFPGGVWRDELKAREWIASISGTGVLCAYVCDQSAHETWRSVGLLAEPRHQTVEAKRQWTVPLRRHDFEQGKSKT